ncbi:hypothetical protein [Aneurinibacillus sp. REN35]|uniref:hypothetical protein n=1 Tax=Aneurinibacillus sp. REN35 TaxID=3237286 RepID=UPI00352902D6
MSKRKRITQIEKWIKEGRGYSICIDYKPWLKIVQDNYEVHYIILRANKEETMKRAINRTKLDEDANIELVEKMWEQW